LDVLTRVKARILVGLEAVLDVETGEVRPYRLLAGSERGAGLVPVRVT